MKRWASRLGGAVLGLGASLAVSASASALECQDLPLMQLRLQDGTMVRIFARDDQINSTKAWEMEEAGEPPLSLPRALKIARKWAAKSYPQFDEVRIGRISLNERRCGFSRGHWFYVFDFDPIGDGTLQLGTEHFVVILMDGTVLSPSDAPPTE